MSDADEAKIPRVGTFVKPGQYLEGPAKLTWTTKKPTAPGLYWHRNSLGRRARIVEVELEGDVLKVDDQKTDQCKGNVANIEGYWAGPLLPPR